MRAAQPRTPSRAILANRPFAALWVGQTVSSLGDTLNNVALLWHVLDATGSAFLAGGIAVAATGGRLLGGTLATAILDRTPARRVMLLSDGARGLASGAIGLLWATGSPPPLALIYALAFAIAAGGALFDPARAATLPLIVAREGLVTANALDKLAASLVQTIIFALSGAIVAALGPAPSLLLDAATFLVSFAAVSIARWEDGARTGHAPSPPRSDLLAGLRWVCGDPLARTVLLSQLLYAIGGATFFSCIAPFLRRHLDGGAAVYGMQGAVFSAGLIAGSWAIGRAAPRRIGALYAAGLVVNGLGNTGFALSSSLATLLPAVFVAGLGMAAYATSEITLLQSYAPPALRGRVFALTTGLATAVAAPSLALGGWLGDRVDPRWVVLLPSLAHVAIGVGLAVPGRVREARSDVGRGDV